MITQDSIITAFTTISCCPSYSNAVAVADKRATISSANSMAPMKGSHAAKIYSTITLGSFSALWTVNSEGRCKQVNLYRQQSGDVHYHHDVYTGRNVVACWT